MLLIQKKTGHCYTYKSLFLNYAQNYPRLGRSWNTVTFFMFLYYMKDYILVFLEKCCYDVAWSEHFTNIPWGTKEELSSWNRALSSVKLSAEQYGRLYFVGSRSVMRWVSKMRSPPFRTRKREMNQEHNFTGSSPCYHAFECTSAVIMTLTSPLSYKFIRPFQWHCILTLI